LDASLHISTDVAGQQCEAQETEHAQIWICTIPLLTLILFFVSSS